MAAAASRCPLPRHRARLAICLLIAVAHSASAQLSATYQYPCKGASEFFDVSTLQCSTCPTGTFPSASKLYCVSCTGSNGTMVVSSDQGDVLLPWTSTQRRAGVGSGCVCSTSAAANQTVNGTDAILNLPTVSSSPTEKATVLYSILASTSYSNNSVVMENMVGNKTVQVCLSCPLGTIAADDGSGCVADPRFSTQSMLNDLDYIEATLKVTVLDATQAVFRDVKTPSGSQVQVTVPGSAALTKYLLSSARACLDTSNREACNAVANLCVLQQYVSDSPPCILYTALVNQKTQSQDWFRSTNTVRPKTGPLPWLTYNSLPSLYLKAEDVGVRVSFSTNDLAKGVVKTLSFVLSAYALNGTWLGMRNFTTQFQLCGAPKADASDWRRFGRNYQNSCQLDVADLVTELDMVGVPCLFDLYMMTGPSSLYPVPITLQNTLNPYLGGSLRVRRFFYVDGSLGTDVNGHLQVLQYPSLLSLKVTLRRGRKAQIYPPVLTIKYTAVQLQQSLQQLKAQDAVVAAQLSLPAKFEVLYVNDSSLVSDFWKVWQQILICILVIAGLPLWLLRLVRYIRFRRNETVDVEFLLYAAFQVADIGSFMLCIVLTVVSLYWLVFTKLQQQVHVLVIPDRALYNYWVTIILAIVGQTLGLLNMLFEQTRCDVFFLDWEKPRRILSKAGTSLEPAPVSCWRTMFVANEWNELQTMRLSNPSFTLLFVVMVLEGLNTYNARNINPDAKDFSDQQFMMTSKILGFGATIAWFIVIVIVQVLFKVLVHQVYICHPMQQFIDLLFLSNVSLVAFDNKYTGFYLHGRNQAQHSDTVMAELNRSLLKEKQGLVAHRGFISSYHSSKASLNESQCFRMFVPPSTRRSYEEKLLRHVTEASVQQLNEQGYMKAFVQGPDRPTERAVEAREEMAQMFKDLLDNVESNHATQVLEPTYAQQVLQLPPSESSDRPVFIHDLLGSFSKMIFYGNELRLATWEALFFATIDMELHNPAVSAFVTWLVVLLLRWLRADLGEANLSRKTLVDKHFLI